MAQKQTEGKHKQTRLARLIRLINWLKTGTITSAQPWKELDIEKTQFYEDQQYLKDHLGFVFKYDRKLKRQVIVEEPFLPVLNLSSSQLLALTMAIRQLSTSGDYHLATEAINALRQVIGSFSGERRAFFAHVLEQCTLKEGFGCEPSVIDALYESIQRQARVELRYKLPRSDAEELTIQFVPYHLLLRKRSLYLDGYQVLPRVPSDEDPFRTLRVDRIRSVKSQGMENIAVSDDYDLHERWRHVFQVYGAGQTPQHFQIKFSAKAWPYVTARYWHSSQHFAHNKKGQGGVLSLDIADPTEAVREFAHWILEGQAEVLEPATLRHDIHQGAVAAAQKHEA